MKKTTTLSTMWTVVFTKADNWVEVRITPYKDVLVTAFGTEDVNFTADVDFMSVISACNKVDVEYLAELLQDMNELAGYLADIDISNDEQFISYLEDFSLMYEIHIEDENE